MPLASGTRLGLYEIVSPLGSGGMGEVYRAQDTRLGREVAVKVLPDVFAADPERIARLEREARVLASLNHPHIAALYGLDQSGGQHFLIMELVEGETLADRLHRGPLSVEEALKLALGIAAALEAAHEKAIVHRDLKPANVKIAPDGKIKVLDFGLAKAGAEGEAAAARKRAPRRISQRDDEAAHEQRDGGNAAQQHRHATAPAGAIGFSATLVSLLAGRRRPSTGATGLYLANRERVIAQQRFQQVRQTPISSSRWTQSSVRCQGRPRRAI